MLGRDELPLVECRCLPDLKLLNDIPGRRLKSFTITNVFFRIEDIICISRCIIPFYTLDQ